jgi:hypothetical protein
VERAQREHVEARQGPVHVIVVEHRVGQPPQVARRADRLGQLLVKAVPRLLRRGVGRHDHERGSPPVPRRVARHDEAGGAWHRAGDGGA